MTQLLVIIDDTIVNIDTMVNINNDIDSQYSDLYEIPFERFIQTSSKLYEAHKIKQEWNLIPGNKYYSELGNERLLVIKLFEIKQMFCEQRVRVASRFHFGFGIQTQRFLVGKQSLTFVNH